MVAASLALVALSDGLLATDYVLASLASASIGTVVTLAAFWLFAPDEVYPVTRKHGRSAHLDLGGARGVAIREAVAHQVGLEVVDITPFGLAGSAGSSPMRLTVAGDGPRYVFAKLFSQQHVRSDRIYKLTRSMLYGRLEDERAFSSARRLAEFEDYTLRVFRDAGVPVVTSYGIVELAPSASTCSSRSSPKAAGRWGTRRPRWTTAWSMPGCAPSAGCGMAGSPTAM